MKTKHIILRNLRGNTRDPFLGEHRAFPVEALAGATLLPATFGGDVEIDEIDRRDIVKLSAEASTVAIAPAMPMKLIAPFVTQPVGPAGGVVAWGVKAVGASASPWTGDGVVLSR